MRLHLIRHGMTLANERRLYCGSSDIPLSVSGRAQLEEKKAAGGYPAPRGCRLITSGMRRTEETFAILYGDLAHERVPALREMDFGDFEMHSYDELAKLPEYQAWIADDNYVNVCPNGESGMEMLRRVVEVVDELLSHGEDALIVTHGGVIAGIMGHFFPREGKTIYEWQPSPGEGYTVTVHSEHPDTYFGLPVR